MVSRAEGWWICWKKYKVKYGLIEFICLEAGSLNTLDNRLTTKVSARLSSPCLLCAPTEPTRLTPARSSFLFFTLCHDQRRSKILSYTYDLSPFISFFFSSFLDNYLEGKEHSDHPQRVNGKRTRPQVQRQQIFRCFL